MSALYLLSRRRNSGVALATGVQTFAVPICIPDLLRELEPARCAPFEAGREPSAAIGIPLDLRDAEALADRVQDVEQLVFQLVPRQPFADQVGVRLVDGIVARRLDRDVELGDRPLPRAEDAEIVEILLLHILAQFEVPGDRKSTRLNSSH